MEALEGYDYIEIVKELLNNNAYVNAEDSKGFKVLNLACRDGHLDVVKELLRFGARTEGLEEGSPAAIHQAAVYGHDSIITELLEHDASIDVECEDGSETALHKATKYGHIKCVEVLLNHGANINSKNDSGEPPLQVAILDRDNKLSPEIRLNLIQLFLTYKSRIDLTIRSSLWRLTALEMAIMRDENVEIIKQMLAILEQRLILNSFNANGESPLHIACLHRNAEVVEELLKNGADPNLKSSKLHQTQSPLHFILADVFLDDIAKEKAIATIIE